ncbi:MAG: NAD(P)/FAD-dependent oxidoreductase [bacterium]|nr:NAD(P)/FAD-dependent oxidoreductase [bacterium]
MNKVAIVGGGLAGLTAALRLRQNGFEVEIFERYPEPGGLARVFEAGGEPVEAFYHHIFSSDASYVALARELNVEQHIEWLSSRMGIWADNRLWDFGTPASLLRFTPLGIVDKLRFALTTLQLQLSADRTQFEEITASEWLRKHQGERAWKTVWQPLFRQKFAEKSDDISMVWLWGKLRLRGRSRSKSGAGEKLGYMRGSFGVLVEALAERVIQLGGKLRLGEPVRRIDRNDQGFNITHRGKTTEFDQVIVATPIADYLRVASHLFLDDYLIRLGSIEATAALCTVLELDRQLTPYYWLNVADDSIPFGGLIEHTNFVSPERYGGRRILYISNYMMPTNDLFWLPAAKVLDLYLPFLSRFNPDFDPSWIIAQHHFRAETAQPVVTPGYSRRIPRFETPVPGLFLCSMAQVYPWDRGLNYAIEYGERVASKVATSSAN